MSVVVCQMVVTATEHPKGREEVRQCQGRDGGSLKL